MITLKIKPSSLAVAIGLAIATSHVYAGECTYQVDASWNTGFVSTIKIKNDTATAIDDWQVSWSYQNNQISSIWNAELADGYTATPLSWNRSIAPGQSIEFGLQGTLNGGLVETPVISGDVCTTGPVDPGPVDPDPVDDGLFRVNEHGNITKNGDEIPIQCGNWFGLEGRHEPSNDSVNPGGAPMELYVGNSFWANDGQGTGRTIQQTMDEIKDMGMNVIRFPIAPQTLDPTNPQGMAPYLKNHPNVVATNARQQMEDFIKLADENDIQVIIDIHSCSNYVGWRAGRLDARPPFVDITRTDYDFLREGYSCAATGNPDSVTKIQAYDKEKWLDNLRDIAGLSETLKVSNILGIDVFNEPWDYSWAEWKSLTEEAYVAINEVNPNILIFVEGISDSYGNQDGTPDTIGDSPHGESSSTPNWGENFYEFGDNPINIPKDRLVLSPHAYGPSVFVQPMYMDPSQPKCDGLKGHEAGEAKCNIVIDPVRLKPSWEEHFGYLRDQGYAMVMGEFGGNMDWPDKASLGDQKLWGGHITPGVDKEWQAVFTDYMVEKDIDGCYWGMNPESGDTGGWYEHAYDPNTNPGGWGEWLDFEPRKTNLLHKIWPQ